MKFLFIGGPEDGRFLDVIGDHPPQYPDDHSCYPHYIERVIPKPLSLNVHYSPNDIHLYHHRAFVYRQEVFHTGYKRMVVYVYNDISREEWVEYLIQHYGRHEYQPDYMEWFNNGDQERIAAALEVYEGELRDVYEGDQHRKVEELNIIRNVLKRVKRLRAEVKS